MTTPAHPPLRAHPPQPPDRDFDTLREAALDVIRTHAPTWTDHNASGAGITLMEAAVWALADAHYRTANRVQVTWPVEAALYAPSETRHWSCEPLPAEPGELAEVADVLAANLTALTEAIEDAPSMHDATAAVLDAAPTLDPDQVEAVVRLVRRRLVLRAGLDGGRQIDAAIIDATEAGATDVAGEAGAVLDTDFPHLWPPEREAIARRHIHHTRLRSLRLRADALRDQIGEAAGSADAVAAVTAETGLAGAAAAAATGIHPCPPDAWPETWEEIGGATRQWPPHPLQARTVEPTAGTDYARLARAVVGAKRAWAVPKVLPGVGWDGQPTTAVAERRGAITILVDPTDPGLRDAPAATKRDFLRMVLRNGLALPWEVSDDATERTVEPDLRGEVDDPHRLFRDDLDRGTPRRLICDEIGAAMLSTCPITLRGVIHAPVTADRDRVLQRALQRVAAFLEAGRHALDTEPALDCAGGTDGPWPPPPPPAGGWLPGEAIRVAELVQRLTDDPDVLGIEALEVRTEGATWQDRTVELDPQCVPGLAETQCVEVRLELGVAP